MHIRYLVMLLVLLAGGTAHAQFQGTTIDDIEFCPPGGCIDFCDYYDCPPLPLLGDDLAVVDIREGGCTGPVGLPMVHVVLDTDLQSDVMSYVDVFVDPATTPTVGMWGDPWWSVNLRASLAQQGTSWSMDRDLQEQTVRVCAIVDTIGDIAERDETNNVLCRDVTFRDCYIN